MATLRSRTVQSSAGDYSSMTAWEAGEQADIVAADEIRRAVANNFNDTAGGVVVDGWTTDATRYAEITVASGQGHGGSLSAGYSLQSNGFLDGIHFVEDFVRVDGVRLETGSNWQNLVAFTTNTNVRDIRISNCVFDQATNNAFRCLYAFALGANGVLRAWNNIFYGGQEEHFTIGAGTAYFYSNTCVGRAVNYGFASLVTRTAGTLVAKNNLVDTNSATNLTCYTGTTTGNNNLSTDTSAPGTSAQVSVTPTFVNRAGLNFLLDAGDTAAAELGADLSGDANLAFSTDILGASRGATWDIGAHQVNVSGATGTTGGMASGGRLMRGILNGSLTG